MRNSKLRKDESDLRRKNSQLRKDESDLQRGNSQLRKDEFDLRKSARLASQSQNDFRYSSTLLTDRIRFFFVDSYNEQLIQSLQKAEKDLKHIEEKHHKHLHENRTSHLNEINEYKLRIKQLENENEQLKCEEIVHVEPTTTTDIQTITINNEEREQLENEIQRLKQIIDLNQQKEREYNDFKQKSIGENEEYKQKIENLQVNLTQRQSQENELKQEIERLKQVCLNI